MAPIVNWPSAPIFQTLALNPIESPTPIRINGVALTISSVKPNQVVKGWIKKVYRDIQGSLSRIEKMIMPLKIVRTIAMMGDNASHDFDCSTRRSRVNMR